MHAHVWELVSAANLDAFIAYGVTALRDPGGGSSPWMRTLVDRSEFTNDPVPRVFFCRTQVILRCSGGCSPEIRQTFSKYIVVACPFIREQITAVSTVPHSIGS